MKDPKPYDNLGPLAILRNTRVSDIMETEVITVREDEPLSIVHNTFVAHHLTHVIIVDETNRISGIISQKYLYKAHSPRKILSMLDYDSDKLLDGDSYYSKEALNSFRLKKIMKASPFTVKPDKSVFYVASLMAKRMLGCVPVVDNNKYVLGYISEQILVKFFVKVMSLDS